MLIILWWCLWHLPTVSLAYTGQVKRRSCPPMTVNSKTFPDAAGILTVLLQCPRSIIRPHLDLITTTITHLTTLASYNGHLPTSLPAKHRSDSLVQICHGSPGLLLLLSTFRGKFPNKYLLDWDDVERKASRAIWEEGLVRKGLGVCHGVTGEPACYLWAGSSSDTASRKCMAVAVTRSYRSHRHL